MIPNIQKLAAKSNLEKIRERGCISPANPSAVAEKINFHFGNVVRVSCDEMGNPIQVELIEELKND